MRTLLSPVFCLPLLLLALFATAAERPHFAGEVGQLAEGAAFTEFIFDHEKEVVRLSVTINEADFEGQIPEEEGEEILYFVIWEACEDLPVGEKPSIGHCSGTEFNIEPDGVNAGESGLLYFRGLYRLEGYFAVVGCSGPHQGLMGCTLKALEIEEAI